MILYTSIAILAVIYSNECEKFRASLKTNVTGIGKLTISQLVSFNVGCVGSGGAARDQ